MTVSAFPLHWPTGWKRTQPVYRREARFSTSRTGRARALNMHESVARVIDELQRMGVGRDDMVISTNVELRLDGLPRGDRSAPGDTGAAVYWQEEAGARRVMAIDQYDRVEDNLAAIAATLDAMRAIERHGGALILERAFTGFTALPAPAGKEWWDVLQCKRDASRDVIRAQYKRLASEYHPDRPDGSHEQMAALNAAQDAALKEFAP